MTEPDWAAYRARLSNSADEVLWDDARDLSRLSLDAVFGEFSPLRRDRSAGFIRLTGPGVQGNSARVDSVAEAMHNFQRLVLATGAALEGHRSLRGNPPAEVVTRTRLQLAGSALPGSLILELAPETLPAHEIAPDGQGTLFDRQDEQLVDRAVGAALDLLQLSKQVGGNADDSEFLRTLTENGPRVATTLRDLAASLVAAQFNTEVSWERPRAQPLRARMSIPELQFLGTLVASRELEKEPISFDGVLRTVSDLGPWKLEVADGDVQTIDASAIDPATIQQMKVGLFVRITANVTEELSPGGATTTHYSATHIDNLVES